MAGSLGSEGYPVSEQSGLEWRIIPGWVSRCSQLLADSKVEQAKVCLARVTTGLNTDLTRISTAFRRFDMDESKHLDETEIMRLAAYLGVDVNPKDLDHNTDGEISLSEFQDFVGRMGGIQQLFEQRRRRVAETRRDTLSMAGVAIGARVLAHFYAGVKPDRYKSPEPEEAVVLGVHYKDDDMAGPSQLEVELEFLRQDPTTLERTKKATCVPSHWIVSTSEDAEVAAALREVGIHDEDQPFWDAVFPASETREVCRLTTCQRRALALVRAQATYLHQVAYPRVLERFQKMGYTDKELQAVLSWVQDLAPVIIHVQLDTVGRFLESDEFYRSQFETKTSNGALDDGNNIRIGWEEDLFGDAYHDATAFERCKYGALNVTNDFEGCKSAIQYGDSYLVLKDVRLRCSFAATDSGGIEGSRLAVLDKYAHVLEEYDEHEIQGILDVAMAPEPRSPEELPKLLRGSTENSIREWLTFGFPQLKRKEGRFFFEVELKEGCILPHVGLAGDQFIWKVGVKSVCGIGGIGDDEYSCGVDGLHGACLKNGPVGSWNVSWPKGSLERVHFDCENYEREQSEILGKTVLVGVLVDLDQGSVTFASDGAWGNTWKPQITQEDMPCYHEGLFPAISIKGSASFHFGPDFKHPPPKSFCDFTPWAKLGEVRVDNPAVGCSDVLNIYKEAQIHGEVCLKKHVLRLVANKRYRQQTRSWTIQVTGAGRCNGTYQWFDRFNKRSCYKSPSGCIIYYDQQESSWRINFEPDFTGFVFQAKTKDTSRYVSNMGGHSEPPRTGWKPTLGLKGCVPVEIFQKALVQQGVPTEDLERMIKVLRGTEEEKDSIFRKLGETTFKAEWNRLIWSPHARPLSAQMAWTEVVRLAQARDILSKLGLSTSTAVVVSPPGEPDGSWECLVSLGPREESDSSGVAFTVINLRGGDAEELHVSSPALAWRHAGPGARAAAALPLQGLRGWLGTDDPIPGIVVERGPGTLRRLQLDADALMRKDIFWPLQELGEVAEKPKSMSGRWSSGNGRCALKVDEAGRGRLWLLRNQTGPQERCLTCQYDATERSLTGVAKDEANEAEEIKVALTMSADALTLTGTLGAQEMSFRRMTDAASFVWGSVNELGNSETSSVKRIAVNYRKGTKACDELQFTLDDRWPFTPIVLEAFKSPSGPAQDAKVRSGWYLDIVETFFNERSDVFEEMAGDQKFLDSLEEAHRQIHSLYDLLLRGLERTPLRLVFVNALEVEQLPEAEIQISAALREELGELSETGTLTGKGLKRGSPAFLAGVRAGWQVNVERSLQQTRSQLGPAATEGSASEDPLKFLLDASEERVLSFSMDSRESLEVQVSTTSCETVQISGADSVVVRCDTCRTGNAAGRYLLVLSPTGGEYGIPNKDQLQNLAEAWEESCDRLFGLKGEEVSVERDAWDEVRLRALCAHHGWEFSWMTEHDERRRRIAKGGGN